MATLRTDPVSYRNEAKGGTKPHGEYRITTPAATSVASANVALKVAGTTTATKVSGMAHTDNRLTLNAGEDGGDFLLMVNFAATGAAGSKVFEAYPALNGTIISGPEKQWTCGTGEEHYSLQHVLQLKGGDYVEIFVENTTDTTNITFGHMVVTLVKL